MSVLLPYLSLLFGFYLLIKGADLLVDGSSSIAKKLKIPTIVIGLTIISIGTSAPELIVSLVSAFQGKGSLAMGGIIGSNISNTLLILGASALVWPILVKSNTLKKEIPVSLMLSPLIILAIAYSYFSSNGSISNIDFNNSNDIVATLTWPVGVMLLTLFGAFLFYVYNLSKTEKHDETEEIKELSSIKTALYILLGIIGLGIGSKLAVDGAVTIAKDYGISDNLIGLTVIALGTSLPELAASVGAAIKKQGDMVIGNVIGSNIFNVLLVLGVTISLNDVAIVGASLIDLAFLTFITAVLLLMIPFGDKNKITNKEGYVLVSLYVIYTIFIIYREIYL